MNASNKHSAGKRLPDGKRAKADVTPIYLCSRNHHLTKNRRKVDAYALTTIGQLVLDHAPRLAEEATTDAGPAEALARREVGRLEEQIRSYHRRASEMDPDDLVAILGGLRADLVEAKARAVVVTSARRGAADRRRECSGRVAGAHGGRGPGTAPAGDPRGRGDGDDPPPPRDRRLVAGRSGGEDHLAAVGPPSR